MDAEIARQLDVGRRLDEIKKLFDDDARMTLFIRHGEGGDVRDVIFGEDRKVSELLARNFCLKAAE